MKFKKLGFTTLEGLSLANFEDGWSMEYGSGGSYTADVLLNGKLLATVEEEGNGGPANVRYANHDNHHEGDAAVLAFLKRTNQFYGPDSDYDFCKNATEASDHEYASLVADLVTEYETNKFAKKQFKAGHKIVMVLTDGNMLKFLANRVDDEQALLDYAKNKGYFDHDRYRLKCFKREATLGTI